MDRIVCLLDVAHTIPTSKRQKSRSTLPCLVWLPLYSLVKVWDAFRYGHIGPLHLKEEIIYRNINSGILQNVLLPYVRQVMRRGWIFQQENDPKHTSAVVKDFIAAHRIQLLELPSMSTNLNPIENLWRELKHRCIGLKAKNKDDKFRQLQEKWSKILVETLNHLVESMPRRCHVVIDSTSYPTKY